jgi:hypothetical protein
LTSIFLTSAYKKRLTEIEDYIFSIRNLISDVEAFDQEHRLILDFLSKNPNAPALHFLTGDRSWPSHTGRYRVFFNLTSDLNKNHVIYMTDIIDNKQANLALFPSHEIPTFHEED